jgi:hypothetical protein
VRVSYRAGVLSAVLAALCLLAPAAQGSVVTIDKAPGVIYDVDATRILFKQSDTELGIMDRATRIVTTVAAPSQRHVTGGQLTPHGTLFGSSFQNSGQLHEVYDGVLTTLFTGATSLEVEGNFATWTGPDQGFAEGDLYRRDLTIPPVVGALPIASDVLLSSTQHDLAPNGDVVWSTHEDSEVKRYRAGTTTTLATPDEEFEIESKPRTDGVNALWSEANGAV